MRKCNIEYSHSLGILNIIFQCRTVKYRKMKYHLLQTKSKSEIIFKSYVRSNHYLKKQRKGGLNNKYRVVLTGNGRT